MLDIAKLFYDLDHELDDFVYNPKYTACEIQEMCIYHKSYADFIFAYQHPPKKKLDAA